MKTAIVLGLGYGDEGKGLTTDFLCSKFKSPLVIRFSGGHQAGHTVVTEKGERHIFSSFGSGTLRGAATYWSPFCTLYPIAFFNEYEALKALGKTPIILVDALTMITTPYDLFFNRKTESNKRHGSCGVGFGATIERNESPFKLFALDLLYPLVFEQKLAAIKNYYETKKGSTFSAETFEETFDYFLKAVKNIKNKLTIVQQNSFFKKIKDDHKYDGLIFEGSQGILLDQDFGFFPNVTRVYVTSKNAMEIIKKHHLPIPETYYVTRAYQTRHGNGFLNNETIPLNYSPNPNETNQYNPWQGHQRVSPLDIDLLSYAIQCDKNYSGNNKINLVVTCLDQLTSPLTATLSGKLITLENSTKLAQLLPVPFEEVFESYSERLNTPPE